MGLSDSSKLALASKLVLGKSHTDLSKEASNESEGVFINVPTSVIFGDTIPSVPATAVTDGVAKFYTCDLVEDPTSNGKSYFAVKPTTISSGPSVLSVGKRYIPVSVVVHNSITYSIGEAFTAVNTSLTSGTTKEILKNAVSPSFGSSYVAVLKSGASIIPAGDPRNWIYQYQSGLFVQEVVGTVPTTIELYEYIGSTAGTGSSVLEPRTIYVTKNGDDSTGAIGGLATSFLTINAAYTYAKTQTPTQADPVFIKVIGTFNEDLSLDTSFINIIGNNKGTLLNTSNPGLTLGDYVDGIQGVVANPSRGGWDETEGFYTYQDRLTFQISVGAETWTYAEPFLNVPFTIGYSGAPPGGDNLLQRARGFEILNSFISRFNIDTTQNFRAHVNNGNINSDLGNTLSGSGFEGITIASTSNHLASDGTTLSMTPTGTWSTPGGNEVSPTSGGLDAITAVLGIATTSFTRPCNIKELTIGIGVEAFVKQIDLTGIIVSGVSNSTLQNVKSSGEVVASNEVFYDTFIDVHSPRLLSSCDLYGYFSNCSGEHKSFSGSLLGNSSLPTIQTGCIIDSCYALDNSFGYKVLGSVTNCTGRDNCFGREFKGIDFTGSSLVNATILNCTGRDYCFDFLRLAGSARLVNCTARDYSFSSLVSGTLTGVQVRVGSSAKYLNSGFFNCTARDYSFLCISGDFAGATNTLRASGYFIIKDCTAGDNSFIASYGEECIYDGSSSTLELGIRLIRCRNLPAAFSGTKGPLGDVIGAIKNIEFIDCVFTDVLSGKDNVSASTSPVTYENIVFRNCTMDSLFTNLPNKPLKVFTLTKVELIGCIVIGDSFKVNFTSNVANFIFTDVTFSDCNFKGNFWTLLVAQSTTTSVTKLEFSRCKITKLSDALNYKLLSVTLNDCNVSAIHIESNYILDGGAFNNSTTGVTATNISYFNNKFIGYAPQSNSTYTRCIFENILGTLGIDVTMLDCIIQFGVTTNTAPIRWVLDGWEISRGKVYGVNTLESTSIQFFSTNRPCKLVNTTVDNRWKIQGDGTELIGCTFTNAATTAASPAAVNNVRVVNCSINKLLTIFDIFTPNNNCVLVNSNFNTLLVLGDGCRVERCWFEGGNSGSNSLQLRRGSTNTLVISCSTASVGINGSGNSPTARFYNNVTKLGINVGITKLAEYNTIIDPGFSTQ